MKYLIIITTILICVAVFGWGESALGSGTTSAQERTGVVPVPATVSSEASGLVKTGATTLNTGVIEAFKDGLENEIPTEEQLLQRCPVADGFVFPVGPPDAKGYYDAQPFGNNFHLGEDWNGRGGGNSDLGDPIHSVADGIVFFAEEIAPKCGNGWGVVVRILHNKGTTNEPKYVDSLYAHLDEVFVKPNDIVTKGQQIGTMGNCHGTYYSHLHFEMRSKVFMSIGAAYGANKNGYINPTRFLKKNRSPMGKPNRE